jgi:hypothetical protein
MSLDPGGSRRRSRLVLGGIGSGGDLADWLDLDALKYQADFEFSGADDRVER